MNLKQKRNLVISYIFLFSFIIWGIFFNNNDKKMDSSNISLSNDQIKILSDSLIIPSQGDIPMKDIMLN